MKRSKRNVDELGAYSDLLLYAILASLIVFFICLHCICAFVLTGFETGGFAQEWSSVLTSNLRSWGVLRWTVGIPMLLFVAYVIGERVLLHRLDVADIDTVIFEAHPNCVVVRIMELNNNLYLDRLYEETASMCRKANIRMPHLYYVQTPELNAYTTTSGNGTQGIVLFAGLIEAMSFADVKAVISHEIGHIISRDVAYSRWIDSVVGALTASWFLGHILTRVYAKQLLHSDDCRDANPVEWICGIMLMVVGNILVVFGGIADYFGRFIGWLRSRQAEYIADSRGAALLDDEQDFADMIIVLYCVGIASSPKCLREARPQELTPRDLFMELSGRDIGAVWRDLKYWQLILFSKQTCPGSKYAQLDEHPNYIDRVRRIRPSFDGNFKRAYLEIINNRRKEQSR